MVIEQSFQEIVEKVDKLPEHVSVAIKVVRMLDGHNDDLEIQDLIDVISLDQSLVTILLKLCNSAHYGFSRKIASVQDAISKLGFKTIKTLVFVAMSQGILNQEIHGYSLEKGDLWRNSVSCAVYSRYLAKIFKYHDPEEAFIAGLLRDIGKLVIHEYVGVNMDEIEEAVTTDGISFVEAENKVLGFNHCRIGSAMALKWNIPTVLADVINYHHDPFSALRNRCTNVDLITIVHLSDSITIMLGTGIGADGLMYNLDINFLERIGLKFDLEKIMSELTDLNSEINSMINIE